MSFTDFQLTVARLVLDAVSDIGFALGGGQALHAHGYGDRPSMDLDFYQTSFDVSVFDRAEVAVLQAAHNAGFQATVGHSDSWLRQIIVTDPATSEQVALDLGQDYRQHPPVLIANLGLVISAADAAASKARALNDRRAARDYLDIAALLSSGAWTPTSLYTALRDQLRPTLTVEQFAADLAAAGDQDPEDYTAYGLDAEDIAHLATAFNGWAEELSRTMADSRARGITSHPARPGASDPARQEVANRPSPSPFSDQRSPNRSNSPGIGL